MPLNSILFFSVISFIGLMVPALIVFYLPLFFSERALNGYKNRNGNKLSDNHPYFVALCVITVSAITQTNE